jgi:hypothetical protein
MLRKPTIRALGSILLLLTFTFSTTPKILLHRLLAHHIDTHFNIGGQADQVTNAGYHCDCQSQVVVMPYVDWSPYIRQDIAECPASAPFTTGDQIYPLRHFIFGFRGPPTNTSLV